jgi:hypothetical protein
MRDDNPADIPVHPCSSLQSPPTDGYLSLGKVHTIGYPERYWLFTCYVLDEVMEYMPEEEERINAIRRHLEGGD